MQFESHYYAPDAGGLRLHARDYGGDGPALLLMHGLTRNAADFEPLAAILAPRYRLIVPDQRGRGLSDSDPQPGRYRPDVYAADMIALLASLGIARVGLIGTSMGGLMAMIMASLQPERFPVLVLNDIGPELVPAGLARIAGYVGSGTKFGSWEAAADACRAINADAFPNFADADWLAFARRTCRQADDGRIAFAYDPAIARGFEGEGEVAPANLWQQWDALADTPTLVVRGALSDLLSPRIVEQMAARHAGPFAAVDVPDRGHAPLLDEPVASRAIGTFLAEHYPA